MIPCQSHTAKPFWPSILAWPQFAPAHRDSITTVFAWCCCDSLFITSHYSLQKWVDFVAIRRWKFGSWGFLTRVALIHRASFCIQPYSNGSKWFFVQCLALGQSKQCLHDSRTRSDFHYFIAIFNNWPSRVWCIKITGTESTKSKLRVIGCYSIRTINTIHIFSRLACVFAFIQEKL